MEESERQSAGFVRFTLPLLRAICWTLMTLLGPLRRIGAYRVPKQGGLLVLSNHQADIDPVVVQLACNRPVYFMAKSELFEMPFVRYVLKIFRAFPVKRGEPDRAAIRHAVDLLKNGNVVCVFPEGELSETGDLLPLKAGVALIIRMTGVQVICLGINGTRRVMPYGKVFPRPAFHTIRVEWGEARSFPADARAETIMGWVGGQLEMLIERDR